MDFWVSGCQAPRENFTKAFHLEQVPAKYWVVLSLVTPPRCRTTRESSSRNCSGPRTQLLSGCRCRSRHTTWVPQPRHKPKIRVHSFCWAFDERHRQLLRLVRVRDSVRDKRRVITIPRLRKVAASYNFSGNLQGYIIRKLKLSREFAICERNTYPFKKY